MVDVGVDFLVWAWDPLENATGYEGHAFPDGTRVSERPPLQVTVEPTFRADGLEPDTVMVFFVRAIRETAGGRAVGPWSAPGTGKTLTSPAAPPVAGLHVSAATPDSITWTWTPVESATAYEVQVSAEHVFDDTDAIVTTTETSYTVTGLSPESGRHLRVRAVAGAAEASVVSAWSSPVAGMSAMPPPPPVPTGLQVSATTPDSITWTWTPVESATAYEVQVSAEHVFDDTDAIVTTAESSYTVTGLSPESGRHLRVRAVAGVAEASVVSTWSSPVAGMSAMPPPAIQRLAVTTSPFDPRGYVVGETIGVEITFSEAMTVSGSPRLALEIGEETRHAPWDAEASSGPIVAFRYEVTLEDRDMDGITIGADALELNGGAIRNVNGVPADVHIGPHAVAQDFGHRVLGAPPPTIQRLAVTTSPFDPRGYVVGETIGVEITFSEAVMVSGTPLLQLGIGEELVDAGWDAEASGGAFVAFRYVVTLEDRDEDGISIGADALDVGDGAIWNMNGVEANLDMSDYAIADDADNLVLGAPPARPCTNERSLALRHTRVVVREWNGTPFRVDIVRNFPDSVTDDYLREELDRIGRLADQIEAQLGYRIIEQGDLIEVPGRAREGWDQDYDRYWMNDLLPRERRQLIGFYLNDDNRAWGGEGSPMSAHICCGTTSYNRRFFRAPHWTEWTGANSPDGEAIVHEVFHLLGFKHYFDQHERIGVQMSPGGLDRPWVTGSPVYYATWTDIENLRCIFPER